MSLHSDTVHNAIDMTILDKDYKRFETYRSKLGVARAYLKHGNQMQRPPGSDKKFMSYAKRWSNNYELVYEGTIYYT